MGTINVTKSNVDSSVLIFDNFYKTEIKVNQADYDLVRSYFRSVYSNDSIADDFTSVFFQIQTAYGQEVQELLDEFRGQDGVAVNATVAYYLNGLRSKATLVGVGVVQTPNYYAARNVQV